MFLEGGEIELFLKKTIQAGCSEKISRNALHAIYVHVPLHSFLVESAKVAQGIYGMFFVGSCILYAIEQMISCISNFYGISAILHIAYVPYGLCNMARQCFNECFHDK